MKPQVKIGLYVVTALGTLVFGILFFNAWRGMGEPAPRTPSVAPSVTPEREVVPMEGSGVMTGRGLGRMIGWGLLAVVSVVGLGALAAYDITQYTANRTGEALFDDEGEEIGESTYEQVEKAYGEGDYLEAIRLLREFIREKPQAVHGQIRIAEIYEKDLNNPLAAALEYEEVLQRTFDPERKSWTAIHLVNLYNRLNKPQQAVALMQRVVAEFPETPAAAKARDRLEASGIELTGSAEAPEGGGGHPPDPEPPSNLPPGFRPRGG
ncbi:MAG: tetratricopeptide repeat protein [Verrucomicrobiae bacterium]|nr:tetratricopeptide repeat protein [Verrucomicrobiae bacterium]